jgi:hypothetical protein
MMSIEAKKLRLIQWLLTLKDEAVLQQIENLQSGTDFWDKLSADEQREINLGIIELDKGHAHAYEEIVAAHRKR